MNKPDLLRCKLIEHYDLIFKRHSTHKTILNKTQLKIIIVLD